MTTTALDQLRHFHITGLGLEDAMPAPTLAAVSAGRELPVESAAFPIGIAADFSVQPHGKQFQAPFHADSALHLALAALLHTRRPLRDAFRDRLLRTTELLADLLALDATHAEEASSAASVAAAFGPGGSTHLDTISLAGTLRRRRNPVSRMSEKRRERCAEALRIIRQAIDVAVAQPAAAVFYTGATPPPNPFLAELHPTSDPCASALAYVRVLLGAAESTLRALRVAQLELESAYDGPHHDQILGRFHWEAADPTEVGALPPVIVVLSPEQLLRCPLRSLSAMLRSGCPVHAVVAQPVLTTDELRGEGPDLAALAMAHGDAFVLQASLAAPDQLLAGLDAMSHTLRPALALIAAPSTGGWAESVILILSRAWPLFTFDPCRSTSWQECLQVDPIPTRSWTAAHAAVLNPMLDNHFRNIADDAGEQGLVELADYLDSYRDHPPLAVPFLTVQELDGTVGRIAVSRDLAEYCHDRRRAWALLEHWTAATPVPAQTPQANLDLVLREGAERAVARVLTLLAGAPA